MYSTYRTQGFPRRLDLIDVIFIFHGLVPYSGHMDGPVTRRDMSILMTNRTTKTSKRNKTWEEIC